MNESVVILSYWEKKKSNNVDYFQYNVYMWKILSYLQTTWVSNVVETNLRQQG